HLAGQLGALGVPGFLFQEGDDPIAERSFRAIARLCKGAYCRFDATSASQLRDLLSAVAVYASGGRQALERFGKERGGIALQLTHEIDER
ncbi:MAG: VWA domain-containing protein, partial [Gammaproteobacteria bacterium]